MCRIVMYENIRERSTKENVVVEQIMSDIESFEGRSFMERPRKTVHNISSNNDLARSVKSVRDNNTRNEYCNCLNSRGDLHESWICSLRWPRWTETWYCSSHMDNFRCMQI